MPTLDVIVDLQYGDSGKGKVAHYLCKKKKYTHVLRYNGGANAGHTIYHQGKKFVTHQVPVGVFYGIPSIIGPGCVVDPVGLKKEIAALEKAGIRAQKLVHIALNAHAVTLRHKKEDNGFGSIGTTKRGIGPAYRDKYAREGVLAKDVPSLKPYLIDMQTLGNNAVVLAEGAQGFGLDIDWGDYPFVTASHCTTAGALLNGFSPQSVRHVWGVGKVYETRVGGTRRPFEPKQKIFQNIREVGQEYGATTGRPRMCNWIDMDLLARAVRMNGVTHVVLSKMDVLDSVGTWKARSGSRVINFKDAQEMRTYITKRLMSFGVARQNIYFSERKDAI